MDTLWASFLDATTLPSYHITFCLTTLASSIYITELLQPAALNSTCSEQAL